LGTLGLLGILLAVRHFRRFCALYYLFVIVLIAQILFYISGRYRMAAVPLLVLFAGYAVETVFAALRASTESGPVRWRPVAGWVLPAIVLLIFVNAYNPYGNHSDWHSDAMFGNFYIPRAENALKQGDIDRAYEAATRLLWIANPNYRVAGHNLLAQACYRKGQRAKAEKHLRLARLAFEQRESERVLDEKGSRHNPPTFERVFQTY
jgi:hypothetical protein